VIFVIFRELYLLAICIQFVLSLGNRPQGSKKIYILCIVLFAVIMVLMLYVSIFSVATQLPSNSEQWSQFGNRLANVPAFRDLVISLASTYGLYIVSSFMHFEPWHMFTCFIQYMLLLPAFVNILMVYAFCNTHDVSWGTKGDTGVGNDLGHAMVQAGGKVEMEVTDRQDINNAYAKMLETLKVRPEPEKKKRDASTRREDYYKEFRTKLVLAWMFSNALLVIGFTSQAWENYAIQTYGNEGFNPYLAFIFWSVAALSAFRFLGSTTYLVMRLIWG